MLKASPITNLRIMNELEKKGVTTPRMRQMMLLRTMAGIRPYASPNHPKKIMPLMAPRKKQDLERAGIQALPVRLHALVTTQNARSLSDYHIHIYEHDFNIIIVI